MDTSEMGVPLQGVAKIFEAGLKSKTWDIHGMPHFITTTHHEGCDMCNVINLFLYLSVDCQNNVFIEVAACMWLSII